MSFESEISSIFTIVMSTMTILILLVSVLLFRKSKLHIFYFAFAVVQFVSLFNLGDLLFDINDVNPVIISEENTYKFYLFIIPWTISMILLVIGFVVSSSKK